MISDQIQRPIVANYRSLYLEIENGCLVGAHFARLSLENEIPGAYQRAVQTVVLQILPATIEFVQDYGTNRR